MPFRRRDPHTVQKPEFSLHKRILDRAKDRIDNFVGPHTPLYQAA